MTKKLQIEGKRFGKILVIKKSSKTRNNKTYWLCKCDCGIMKDIIGSSLTSGNTKSCGCKTIEATIRRNTTHGLAKHALYSTYRGMLQRCNYKKHISYKDYGGRGIKVCQEWSEFIPFYNWATNNGYQEHLTLDRIDVNGNYKPSNCRWATTKEQARNTSRNKFITYKGRKETLSFWSEYFNIGHKTISYRLNQGWDLEKVFSKNKFNTYKNNQIGN